ncbi:MAG TPA: YlbF family regulator [Syntrophomonadaceae bacterium]|nr:YlbF family regulator [Syntrophomonadaceae bacterium]
METEDILKMAHDLGHAISESTVVDELKAAQDQLMLDREAYDLLVRYQDARINLQHKIEDGLLVSDAEESHLDILDQQLKANSVVKSLIDAQEKLDNLMQAVYLSVNQAITGDSCSPDCCESCGGGCGS